MNREILKAKIAEVISSTNKSGNEKLEAILTVVDAYSSADNGAKPIVIGALPPDVTLKDIKEIRNYFGEHDATLFEHRSFSIISRLINHIEATGGNDR